MQHIIFVSTRRAAPHPHGHADLSVGWALCEQGHVTSHGQVTLEGGQALIGRGLNPATATAPTAQHPRQEPSLSSAAVWDTLRSITRNLYPPAVFASDHAGTQRVFLKALNEDACRDTGLDLPYFTLPQKHDIDLRSLFQSLIDLGVLHARGASLGAVQHALLGEGRHGEQSARQDALTCASLYLELQRRLSLTPPGGTAARRPVD